MKMVRRILTATVFILLAVISLASAVQVFRSELPHSRSFDRDQLINWLVDGSMAGQNKLMKLRLARHLEQDFRAGYDWQAHYLKLDEGQQPQFLENFTHLLELLLMQKVDGYFECNEAERPSYLDRQIESIMQWYIVGQKGKSGQGALNLGLETLSTMLQVARQNAAKMDKEDQDRLQEFSSALQRRWMMQGFRNLFPGQ